jgi:hypothetical protein
MVILPLGGNMQHNQPAENENIFSDERVLLRPMDYGQSLVCRKPTDLAKVIGWFIVCFAAYAILISLVSLATGIPLSKVAGPGRSGTEPSAGSQSPRIVLGREPSAGSDSPRIVLELPENATGLVVGFPLLIFGVLILGSVDELKIDLKQRTYRRRRGFLRWTKSSEGTFADFAGLRLHKSAWYLKRYWRVSLVWNDIQTPQYLVASWVTWGAGARAPIRAIAWMDELRDRLGTVSVDTT